MAETVLVTGAGGFVGRLLGPVLAEAGYAVHGAARGDAPAGWPGAWRHLDVTDTAAVRDAVRAVSPSHVVHFATEARDAPLERQLAVNATGTENLLEALVDVRPDAAVLVAGSAAEYGAVPASEQPIREDQPLRPVTPYGMSKAAQAAVALRFAATTPLRIVHARTFNLVGPGLPDSLAAGAFARQLAAGAAVVETGNLAATRDFVDVRDALRAYVLLLAAPGARGVYNVASGRAVRLREMLDLLIRAAGMEVQVHEKSRADPSDVPEQVADIARLRALGWSPGIPLERSLADLLEGLRPG